MRLFNVQNYTYIIFSVLYINRKTKHIEKKNHYFDSAKITIKRTNSSVNKKIKNVFRIGWFLYF